LKFFRSKRNWLILIFVLLVLFFVRPGAQKIKSRIVTSISLALGRPVEISSASIRILPQPGFELENFVVHDDPSFSAEPVLRAQEVTASLRLWSLLRGRLEIARLSLSEPSLNLVRNSAGHWNVESLLERTSQTSVAPTAKPKTELRPGFPYIEADSGRINLKLGEEKKPYAMTDADFALWQESENSWGMRLEAKPVRTDFNLTNTGIVKLSGTWLRAASFHQTPLQIALQWSQGQLGQITTLAYGNDKGWRGELGLVMQISGNPDDLEVQTSASVPDFRRYDVNTDSNLPLAAQCDAHFNYEKGRLSRIDCRGPVQGGFLSAEGDIQSLLGERNYHLDFTAQDVPMQSVAQLFAHVNKDIPQNLTADGNLNAKIALTTVNNEPQWQGQGEIKKLALASDSNSAAVSLDAIPFIVGVQSNVKTRNRVPALTGIASEQGIEIGPMNIALGGATPTPIHGWISAASYNFRIKGDAQIQRLLQLARFVAIPSPQTTADGQATIDLGLSGPWSSFSSVKTTGSAQLHAVHAPIRGLNQPLEIASANLSLTPDQVSVQKLSASIAGSTWHGTITLPRPCAVQETCAAHFNLHADELTEAALDSLLITSSQSNRWYSLLPEKQGPTFLSKLRAAGQLSIDSVEIYKLGSSDLTANADLEAGNLKLSSIHTKMLGGRNSGNVTLDFTTASPTIHATGTFDHIGLAKLADLMDDDWVSGNADATYEFSSTGKSVADILSSSSAELYVNAHDCLLPHITLNEDAPLHMERFTADLVFNNGRFQIKQGNFESAEGKYTISGTALLNRDINIKLIHTDGPEYSINGTIAEPRVAASKKAVARVTPQP
jgi:hypothetical protein